MCLARWSRLGALLPAFLTGLSGFLFAACGGSYQTSKIKVYKLSLVEGDQQFAPVFKQLVADYNQQAGVHVLDYVDNPNDANSPLILTKGLKGSTDGKVGLGQWLSETKADNPFGAMPGQTLSRTVTYSMRIEFDWDFFNDRKADSSTNTYDKQKLFFHEVGHGLEMNHVTDVNDVMYPDIAGQKDFNTYLQRVRDYMSDS